MQSHTGSLNSAYARYRRMPSLPFARMGGTWPYFSFLPKPRVLGSTALGDCTRWNFLLPPPKIWLLRGARVSPWCCPVDCVTCSPLDSPGQQGVGATRPWWYPSAFSHRIFGQETNTRAHTHTAQGLGQGGRVSDTCCYQLDSPKELPTRSPGAEPLPDPLLGCSSVPRQRSAAGSGKC